MGRQVLNLERQEAVQWFSSAAESTCTFHRTKVSTDENATKTRKISHARTGSSQYRRDKIEEKLGWEKLF